MAVTILSPSSASVSLSPLSRSILETLAYSDVFDYPLTLNELHRYLPMRATQSEVEDELRYIKSIGNKDGYYFLVHRPEIVETRKSRYAESSKAFNRAIVYGHMLGNIPFVRMVAVTGSLAVMNLSENPDMDFMLVTKLNRLWIARAFAVIFGRLIRLFGDRICVNLLVAENSLAWTQRDLYSAREMAQMIPICGMETYFHLRESNLWVEETLPNADSVPENTPAEIGTPHSLLQRFFEFFLDGKLGEWIELRAMDFQLKKIARQYGSGEETNFTANVCQGNFHDHRARTDRSFQARLAALGLEE